MSELANEHKRPAIRRSAAALAAVLALGGAALYGPDACGAVGEKIVEWTTDESEIVAGVPGQVEGHDRDQVWTGKMFVWRYYVAVEQCAADIAAAETKSPTYSFDPDIGVIGPGCTYDWVKISPSTYSGLVVGEVITFEGEVGEHLRK